MRWSKLQKEIYKLISAGLHLQIHCVAYRMDSQYGGTSLPRYWITLGKETIFDYPKQFMENGQVKNGASNYEAGYPYGTDVSAISCLIREYIDTPKNEIMGKVFTNDYWGLTDILRAADRRVGTRRLKTVLETTESYAVKKIIQARLGLL